MLTKVYWDETDVVPLLSKMKLPRWALLEMASMTAGERANVREYEPPAVIGFETWRWGTRFCRESKALKELGWLLCDDNHVSGIRNNAVGIKLVVCSTDTNTGNPLKAPKNTTPRGPASCRLIKANSGQLKLGFITEDRHDELWYFCMHFSESSILVEISRPNSEAAGFITNFSDRILVAKLGEIPGISKTVVPQEFADVPRPQVSRKVP